MLLLVTAAVKVQLKNVLQMPAFVHAFAAILGDQSVGTRAWRGLRFETEDFGTDLRCVFV